MPFSVDWHDAMDSHKRTGNSESTAAVKLQKVYRSYRTRRKLADSVVVAEELWWQAIEYARLNHSTVSFFSFHKAETAASRWSRISLIASKVGKGLFKDAKAQKLAFQHWIEAIDPRHRYGRNLNFYYQEWYKGDGQQPFFFWLDIGDGKEVDLKDCPRSRLRQECLKYLGPQERESYEYIIAEEMVKHKQTGRFLDTNQGLQGSRWIFVLSTSKKLYAGEKRKGLFHHSSFLAGGATLAAGRLKAEGGKLKSVSAYSGHYHPTDDNLDSFLAFLGENGINLDKVQVLSPIEDYERCDTRKSVQGGSKLEEPTNYEALSDIENDGTSETCILTQAGRTSNYKRTFSINRQSPKGVVPKKEILQRIKSRKEVSSYQLGYQLSLKWSTGAGPRIGCVTDYPPKLRLQALEFVNLSPRDPSIPAVSELPLTLSSITTSCVVM